LGGVDVEGPDLNLRYRTFAGYHNMPITYGMTVGELARLFNRERSINADLEVVPMQGWTRGMIWEDTGLPWVNPSPNIHNARESSLYAGLGFLEDLPISVGRGTPSPFEVVGAPWMDGPALARDMQGLALPGFLFRPIHFVPGADNYAGRECKGILVTMTDRRRCHPTEMGIYLLSALSRRYPDRINGRLLHKLHDMIGNQTVPQAIANGIPPAEVIRSWQGDDKRWRRRRAPFLLYQ
ncbi:MAG: DUF1343 domain-containing protein, partial [Armatimonadota bacterium]|nr:DUF1343 domain-containing protein [Armatimonadota bacterium]